MMKRRKKRMRRLVRKIGKYTFVVVVVDFVAVSVGLYLADSAGSPPLYYEEISPGWAGRVKEAYKDYVGELDLGQFFTTDLKHLIKKMMYSEPSSLPVREEVIQSDALMEGTVVLNGFRLKYLDNAHRINLMEASVDGVEYDSGTGVVSAKAGVAFEGGDWSRIDGMEYEISCSGVKGGGAVFSHGSEVLELMGGRARKELEIDLEKAGLGDYEEVGVFLRGYQFDSGEEFPDGLNIKGLAVRISPVERKGGRFVVDVVAELKGGEVGFREGPGYFYGTRARILYTLVGMNGGEMKRVGHHYMMLNRERAPERVMKVEVDLGHAEGCFVPVFQGFEFNIHSTKARFIREVSLSFDAAEYDNKTGKAAVLCNGYLSNDGTFPGALDVRFSADMLFMVLPEGAGMGDPVVCAGEMIDVTEVKKEPIKIHL